MVMSNPLTVVIVAAFSFKKARPRRHVHRPAAFERLTGMPSNSMRSFSCVRKKDLGDPPICTFIPLSAGLSVTLKLATEPTESTSARHDRRDQRGRPRRSVGYIQFSIRFSLKLECVTYLPVGSIRARPMPASLPVNRLRLLRCARPGIFSCPSPAPDRIPWLSREHPPRPLPRA